MTGAQPTCTPCAMISFPPWNTPQAAGISTKWLTQLKNAVLESNAYLQKNVSFQECLQQNPGFSKEIKISGSWIPQKPPEINQSKWWRAGEPQCYMTLPKVFPFHHRVGNQGNASSQQAWDWCAGLSTAFGLLFLSWTSPVHLWNAQLHCLGFLWTI